MPSLMVWHVVKLVLLAAELALILIQHASKKKTCMSKVNT